MKKLFPLIVILITFSACTEQIKTSDPGFQAYRDGVFWNGVDVTATKSITGAITIKAFVESEEVNLKISSSAVGTYNLGTQNANDLAIFKSTYNGNPLYYDTTPIFGPVANIVQTSLGSGYASASGVATTGGSGSGLIVTTTADNNGLITGIKISSPGNSYIAGDVITITGGNNNAKFKVVSVEGSNGEIKITNSSDGTITGTFKFNASNINYTDKKVVNFQYGNFYKLPVYNQ